MIRNVIVFIWAPLFGLSLYVFFSYCRAWRMAPGRMGLLPQHVALVTLSYLLLATRDAYEVTALEHNTFNVWVVTVALVIGLVAVVVLMRYERLRLGRLTGNDRREGDG